MTNKPEHEPRKLFVGGLSWETKPEEFKLYFEKFGEVADVIIMKDPTTHKPRGFGFVTFVTEQGVEAVLAAKPHFLDAKQIDPKRASNKSGGNKVEKETKIFIGGIAAGTTDDDILNYFTRTFGPVKEVEQKKDPTTDRPRGFGFVEFEDSDDAEKAVGQHFHTINTKKVEAKRAVARGQQQPASVNQYSNTHGFSGTGSGHVYGQSGYGYAPQYGYSQQQATQQQAGYYGYGHHHHQGYSQQTFPATAVPYNQGDHQYGAAAGGQQGSVSAIHAQHVTPYNQGTAGYSSTAHQAAYPNSEGFNHQSFQPSYSDRSQGTQSSAYQQYDSQSASSYTTRPMVQRSNYDYSAS